MSATTTAAARHHCTRRTTHARRRRAAGERQNLCSRCGCRSRCHVTVYMAAQSVAELRAKFSKAPVTAPVNTEPRGRGGTSRRRLDELAAGPAAVVRDGDVAAAAAPGPAATVSEDAAVAAHTVMNSPISAAAAATASSDVGESAKGAIEAPARVSDACSHGVATFAGTDASIRRSDGSSAPPASAISAAAPPPAVTIASDPVALTVASAAATEGCCETTTCASAVLSTGVVADAHGGSGSRVESESAVDLRPAVVIAQDVSRGPPAADARGVDAAAVREGTSSEPARAICDGHQSQGAAVAGGAAVAQALVGDVVADTSATGADASRPRISIVRDDRADVRETVDGGGARERWASEPGGTAGSPAPLASPASPAACSERGQVGSSVRARQAELAAAGMAHFVRSRLCD